MSQLFAGLSLAVPPLLISTLAKHFLARKKITADNKARDEFLYDEVSEHELIVSRDADSSSVGIRDRQGGQTSSSSQAVNLSHMFLRPSWRQPLGSSDSFLELMCRPVDPCPLA